MLAKPLAEQTRVVRIAHLPPEHRDAPASFAEHVAEQVRRAEMKRAEERRPARSKEGLEFGRVFLFQQAAHGRTAARANEQNEEFREREKMAPLLDETRCPSEDHRKILP